MNGSNAGGNGASMSSLENRLTEEIQEIADIVRQVPAEDPLGRLLMRVIRRRPYIRALAMISPGGKLWASALPQDVEAESIAAMAAPVALLGRRVALEQLGSDMRQTYVEGEGGYAILRTVGQEAVLLILASTDANLALVLHDADLLEQHVARVLGVSTPGAETWTDAAPSIEKLRRMLGEGQGLEDQITHLNALQAKLESLDLGLFPERVHAIRSRLEAPTCIEEIEADLIALEQDVMATFEQDMASSVAEPGESEQVYREHSYVRRALKWLASMIESED